MLIVWLVALGALGTAAPDPAGAATASGSPDRSFGGDGYVSLAVPEGGTEVTDLLRQPDGRVLVSTTDFLEGVGVVMRTTATGRVDRSFGRRGYVEGLAGTTFSAEALAAGPGGSILVAGDVAGEFMVARLLADGRPDPSFAERGVYAGPPGKARSLAVLSNGDVIAGGSLLPPTRGGGGRVGLVRLDPAGRPVPGFGANGLLVSDEGGYRNSLDVLALAAEPNGGFVASIARDTCLPRGHCQTDVRRYLPNGTVDPAFGSAGTTRVGFRAHLPALVRRPAGSYLLAGGGPSGRRRDASDAALVTVSARGAQRRLSSPPFGISRGPADGFEDLMRQPDGKLVAVGAAGTRMLVARFTASGRPDRSFSLDGFSLLRPRRAFYASATAVERLPGGRVLVGGEVDDIPVLLRLSG